MAEFETCRMGDCLLHARGVKHAHIAGTQRPKLRVTNPVPSNYHAREEALKVYLDKLHPNLLRSYLCDHLTDAHPHEVDKFVVLLRATGAVPAKQT